MESFNLDRSAFKGQTVQEASNHVEYYKKLSWKERMQVAAYLNSVAYNYHVKNPPRMNKTIFSAKSFSS